MQANWGAGARGLALGLGLALVVAGAATAGAWPRDKGHVFVSTKLTFDRDPEGGVIVTSGLYAEYGLGGGWMIGIDGSVPKTVGATAGPETVVLLIGGERKVVPISAIPGARPANAGAARGDVVLWLGYARTLAKGLAWGWGLGLGRRYAYAEPALSYLRPGLSLGKGFATGWLPWPGWASAQLQTELPLAGGQAVTKLDLTFGVRPTPDWIVMIEAWANAYPGADVSLRLAPAVLRRFGHAHIGIQPEFPVIGGGEAKLTLAFWSEF